LLHLALISTSALADDAETIRNAEDTVRTNLKDPDSGKFRGEWVTADGAVRGEVNARNGYGGFTGFELVRSLAETSPR
jgi:hypothetical protein